jgi:hypothetical protein
LIHGKIEEADSTIPRKYQVLVVDADKSKAEVAEECRRLIKEFLTKKQTAKMNETADEKENDEACSPKKPKISTNTTA